MENDDILVNQAIELLRPYYHTSIAFLQKNLGIDNQRATRLMDELEGLGVVSSNEDATSKSRKVLKNDKSSAPRGTSSIVCGNCGAANDGWHKFCQRCGKALPISTYDTGPSALRSLANLVSESDKRADLDTELIAKRQDQITKDIASIKTLSMARSVERTVYQHLLELQSMRQGLEQDLTKIGSAYHELDASQQYNMQVSVTNFIQKGEASLVILAAQIVKTQNVLTSLERHIQAQVWGGELTNHSVKTNVENGKKEESVKEQRNVDEQIGSLTLEEVLNELDSLIGLDAVKKDVAELINFLKVQQLRKSKGLPIAPMSLHQVFYGNPGTGKTTVARLLSQIFKSLNILSEGHLVETDRSGLVAGYVGQTALKVTEVVNKALGGILFIDEAYSLAGQGNDFGQEAIETLLKQMEDHRDDLVVIVAGYTDKMNGFLSSNPGLRSRFNRYLKFEDYTPLQLVTIFELFCAKASYHLSPTAREKLRLVFSAAYYKRDKAFGNGRFARNLFERTISNQANRVVALPNASPQTFSAIDVADIPESVIDDLT